MNVMRWIFPVVAAVAALLLLPAVAWASTPSTDRVAGIESAATSTVGRFAGAGRGPLPGSWNATIVHDPLEPGHTLSITGGTFTVYSRSTIRGTFTGGTISPITTAGTCGNERFNVTGTMALNAGGSGRFTVVLTHLRTQIRTACVTYGATVTGTLALAPAATAAT
jgi:hypothetical protein